MDLYNELTAICRKPEVFGFHTSAELWTNEHTSAQMLKYHLNENVDAASRNHQFIDRSTQWIISRFNLGPGSNVIDFGCGPGLYTSRIAECGASVTGLDFSARSLEYARKQADEKNRQINYVQTDYLEFETPEKFDLIIMIMCDFCAISPTQRRALLEKFSRILKPGGAVLLDAYTHTFFSSSQEKTVCEFNQLNGFWSPDDYYCVVSTFKYEMEKVVLDKYSIVEKGGMRQVYTWLQCFDQESIAGEFRDAGLKINQFLGNVAGDQFDPEASVFAVIAGNDRQK